jgi:hypothetical protein
MGLSNYLPNSRINQPGVCTSSTRPASPYEGQVIYETDTDRVLVWNNSAWVDPSTGRSGKSGMVKITPTSISGSGASISNGNITLTTASEVVINGCFTDDFDFYQIRMFLLTSNSQISIRGQFCVSGTATASNYTIQELNAYSTTVAASLSSGQTHFNVGNSTTSTYAPFVVDVFQPKNNTTTHILSQNHNYNAFPDMLGYRGIRHTVDTSFDGIKFYPSAGTFSGNIQIFGMNK